MNPDVIIVGGGPAGCSAALTLRNRNKNVLLFDSGAGALLRAHKITNYPGLYGKSGAEISELMQREVQQAGVDFRRQAVRQILPMGDTFSVLAGEDIFSCRALLLCTGATRKAGLPGESEGIGKGVSYCATCDGMFYKGKTVCVVGSFLEAVEDANFLSTLARETLYFPEKEHDLSLLKNNIRVIRELPKEILFAPDASAVRALRTQEADYPCDGIFILRPAVPPAQLLPGLTTKDGHIVCDERGRAQTPGVFVAGDDKSTPFQLSKAVGDGNIAALEAVAFLDK